MIFNSSSTAQQSIDFETGNLDAWTQTPENRWNIGVAIDLFNNVLKHSYDATSAQTDRISIPLPATKLNAENLQWKFNIGYEYNPSSANNWAVFLMATNNSEAMLPDAQNNAFLIGVNFDGSSDDQIKIWRIDEQNGLTEVFDTNINWQTDVGTEQVAFFEISRTYNGEWTVIFSPDSSKPETEIASFTDNSVLSPLHFGISYRYSSSADRKLFFDNFYFSNSPANNNDRTSTITYAQNPLGEQIITSQQFTEKIPVFAFSISDSGSGDQLPTIVSSLQFTATELSAKNFDKIIKSVSLLGESNIEIMNTNIENDKITLFFDENKLIVPDGETIECVLKIKLKEQNITDKSKIVLQFDKENTACASFISGSGFANNFGQAIVSEPINFEVEATQLMLSINSTDLTIGQPFDVLIVAADNFNNTDTDAANPVEVKLHYGSGNLSFTNGNRSYLSHGKAVIEGLTYNKPEKIILQTQSTDATFGTAYSNEIAITGDKDSEIYPVTFQHKGKINSLADTYSEAVEVLRFAISDKATTDNVPTIVRRLNFKNSFPGNSADWTNTIQGAVLRSESKTLITGNLKVTDSYVSLDIAKNQLIIGDGKTTEVSLCIYLNKSKIEDNTKLQFFIDSNGHYCVADSSGSLFSNKFEVNITGDVFSIDVVASQLFFDDVPNDAIAVNQEFEAEIQATDENENIDTDFGGNVQISSENGNLTINQKIKEMNGGISNWFDLKFEQSGEYTLTAENANLNTAQSETIVVADSDSKIEMVEGNMDTQILTPQKPAGYIEIMKLIVSDTGQSDDLPTIISELSFSNPAVETSVNWKTFFDDVIFISENNDTIHTKSTDTEENEIEINFEPDSFRIENGTTKKYSLWIMPDYRHLTDKLLLQLYINSQQHNCKTSGSSSLFAENFEYDVLSTPFVFDIEASKLQSANKVHIVEKNQPFVIEIMAVDEFSNIDIDASGTANLYIGKNEYTADFSNGVAVFEHLTAIKTGVQLISIEAEEIEDKKIKLDVVEKINTLLCNDFENETLANWQNTQDWITSKVAPISGNMSLRHNAISTTGSSCIFQQIQMDKLPERSVEWNFSVKTGDWQPSASTNFRIYLLSSQELNNEIQDAVYLTVEEDKENYFLMLKQIANQEETTLLRSEIQWVENQCAGFLINREPDGVFRIYHRWCNENKYIFDGESQSSLTISNIFTGIQYNYSSTRAGMFRVDDFCIRYAETAAKIKEIRNVGGIAIEVEFTRNINFSSAADKSNYTIENQEGTTIAIKEIEASQQAQNTITLRFDELEWTNYKLSICGLLDEKGYQICDAKYFDYQTATGYVAINEIMFETNEYEGISSAEYIELLNTTNEAINLQNWLLAVGESSVKLPYCRIESGEFLIISNSENSAILEKYGKTLLLENMPYISNNGTLIELKNANNETVSWVDFEDEWLNDEFKQRGGWALERIDAMNLCGQNNNWTASENSNGGTPGAENSVIANNPDLIAPEIVHLSVLSDTVIQLTYNEPLDLTTIERGQNYTVDSQSPEKIETSLPNIENLQLIFKEQFLPNTTYFLMAGDNVKDCAGKPAKADFLRFVLPQTPDSADIAINEIMFNPLPGSVDFIELYNRTNKTFDLKDLLVARKNNAGDIIDVAPIANFGTLFFPQDYVAICTDKQAITDFYFSPDTAQFVESNALPSLPNDAGNIQIINQNGQTIDFFEYNSDMHFGLITNEEGVSLERVNFDITASDYNNWQSAASNVGYATPAYKNSQYFAQKQKEQNTVFAFSHETITPNNDGIEDELRIDYEFDKQGYVANVMIFNRHGFRVNHLIKNQITGSIGYWIWDGLSDEKKALDSDIYVIYIEAFHLDGNVETCKETCVVIQEE